MRGGETDKAYKGGESFFKIKMYTKNNLESEIAQQGKQPEKQGFFRGHYRLFESNAVSYTLAVLIGLTSITACGDKPEDPIVPPVNFPPVVYDIPSQETTSGNCFSNISLDNYVNDPDNSDSEINWTFSGDSNLNVNITNRIASVCAKTSDWRGSETITLRATDPEGLYDSDSATFSVKNQGPTFSSTPSPTATENSQYQYDADASDPDGDTLTYSLIQSPSSMAIVIFPRNSGHTVKQLLPLVQIPMGSGIPGSSAF